MSRTPSRHSVRIALLAAGALAAAGAGADAAAGSKTGGLLVSATVVYSCRIDSSTVLAPGNGALATTCPDLASATVAPSEGPARVTTATDATSRRQVAVNDGMVVITVLF